MVMVEVRLLVVVLFTLLVITSTWGEVNVELRPPSWMRLTLARALRVRANVTGLSSYDY